MPCRQVSTFNGIPGSGQTGGGGYATEAECLQACKEGACCESNGTCSVKPQCQCQETGQTFKGVGTVCTSSVCYPPCVGPQSPVNTAIISISAGLTQWQNLFTASSGITAGIPIERSRYHDATSLNGTHVLPLVSRTLSQAVFQKSLPTVWGAAGLLRLSVNSSSNITITGSVYTGMINTPVTRAWYSHGATLQKVKGCASSPCADITWAPTVGGVPQYTLPGSANNFNDPSGLLSDSFTQGGGGAEWFISCSGFPNFWYTLPAINNIVFSTTGGTETNNPSGPLTLEVTGLTFSELP